ncbi:m160 protein [Murid betaherpesvirus 1]|nr:m160 protein [Murid betaherpesvirus 1]
MYFRTTLCLIFICCIQIRIATSSGKSKGKGDSGFEVVVGHDKTTISSMTYSCNSSTSSESSKSNVQGTWGITCIGASQPTILATFGSSGFVSKHSSVVGGSSRTRIFVDIAGIGHDSSSDDSREDSTGPSSTIIFKPLCYGMITCNITDNTGKTVGDTSPVLGPLITTYKSTNPNFSRYDTVTASCRPQTMCSGTFNVSWAESRSFNRVANATFWNATQGYSNTTWSGNPKVTWIGGSVQVNGSFWGDDDWQMCLTCEVYTCGLVGMALACDERTARHSSAHRISHNFLYLLVMFVLLELVI